MGLHQYINKETKPCFIRYNRKDDVYPEQFPNVNPSKVVSITEDYGTFCDNYVLHQCVVDAIEGRNPYDDLHIDEENCEMVIEELKKQLCNVKQNIKEETQYWEGEIYEDEEHLTSDITKAIDAFQTVQKYLQEDECKVTIQFTYCIDYY